ncbi:MAG: PIG-L deacetylase family protein [Nitriliruptoraceae bacterium]
MGTVTEHRTAIGTDPVPSFDHLVVVSAHPDDETFGLGGLVSAFVEAGSRVSLVCLTCGERSTLGASCDLAGRRTRELQCAAQVLGISRVTIHHHPDGALDTVDLDHLVADVLAGADDADGLLTFDHGGITGHPDHQRATDVAVAAGRRLGIPVLAWAIPREVAERLRDEYGAPFVGREDTEIDHVVTVDRSGQYDAMTCHGSQLADNPVPRRRIALQGDREYLRQLSEHRPPSRPTEPIVTF